MNKKTAHSNSNVDQFHLTNLQRIFHLAVAEYAFLPNAHKTSSRDDHKIRYKTSIKILTQLKLFQSYILTSME